jgi:asparagine synthase (glutamine-hydrolysing)
LYWNGRLGLDASVVKHMCGICGYVTAPGQQPEIAILRQMNARLRARGPDEDGYLLRGRAGLAMTRLSIIDLASGHQPMSNEDGTVWVVFNGEIYNFEELRGSLMARGHAFRSRSDTEVIVHLYEESGEGCIEKLNGMFAIAIWDDRRQRLILARDRMGEKPLYWTLVQKTLLFGSEPKSLLAHPLVSAELHLPTLSRYLFYQYVPAPWSIYRGIRRLETAQLLVFESGAVRVRRYWEPAYRSNSVEPIDFRTAAQEVWSRLCQSVHSRLISDVPLGVFLSGGVDSTAVVAAMAQKLPSEKIKTFTIGFEEVSFDESKSARCIAEYFGTDHHQEVFSVNRLLDLLPRIADYLDEPFADGSMFPTYLLSQFTRQYVKVALGGDGGDELFAGYPTFQAMLPAAVYRALPRALQTLARRVIHGLPVSHANFSFDFRLKQFVKGASVRPELSHQIWLGAFSWSEQCLLLTPDVLAMLKGWNVEEEHTALASSIPIPDLVNRLTWLYTRTYLAEDLLVKADRAGMANSLEVRSPFLDPELVNFVLALPSDYKLRGWKTKRVLRQALKGRVPDFVLKRGKLGFGLPLGPWLRGPLRDLAGDLLHPSRLRAQGIFNPSVVQRLLEEHWSDARDHRKGLWTLLVFQLWHERFLSVASASRPNAPAN